jgi:retinol dehydrogenase-12
MVLMRMKGFDMEFGINCLAPFLLTSLLLPIMQTVSSQFCHPNTSIRVVWVASLLNLSTPPGGVQLVPSATATPSSKTTSWTPKQLEGMPHYMQSKAGVYFLSQEFGRRTLPSTSSHTTPSDPNSPNNVLHICLHPGFLRTNLQRHAPAPLRSIMGAVFKGPKHGAYTELFAGLGPDLKQGDFVIPWGRKGCVPEHLKKSLNVGEDGLESVSARFYDWCGEQVKPFM